MARATDREKERELWLLLIGACLSGNKGIIAEATAGLDAAEAVGDELIGIFAGLKKGDREHVAQWLERLGVERDGNQSCVQGVITALKKIVLKRACCRAAHGMTASSLLQDPDAFIQYVEEQLELVKAKR